MKSKVVDGTSISAVVWEEIPQFVIDELDDQNAIIIVLTELFQHSTIGYFWAEMESDISTQSHRIMEQMKLEFSEEGRYTFHADDSVVTTMKNNHPNFLLLVDLEDQNGQFPYRCRISVRNGGLQPACRRTENCCEQGKGKKIQC